MAIVPEPRAFLLEASLYNEFELEILGAKRILDLMTTRKTIDVYCVGCEKEAVFRSTARPLLRSQGSTRADVPIDFADIESDNHQIAFPPHTVGQTSGYTVTTVGEATKYITHNTFYFNVGFCCTRDERHTMIFYFRVGDGSASKVGQWPSTATLVLTDAAKYRKVLPSNLYKELTTAIGLNAHGVGIGAFVYLRRIFETLISGARDKARKSAGWQDEVFDRARMDDKVQLLKDHLPDFLVKNRFVYGILSKGLHELTEEQCRDHFETVRASIELILDEEIAAKEKAAKAASAEQALAKIRRDLGGK